MSVVTRTLIAACALAVTLAFAGPAAATSNYPYKPNEFPLIVHGLSPDGRQSLRAHGEGDLGDDNFHLYLFREGPLKRVGPLEEIQPLDTAPDSFTAAWAPDSGAVAISFRSDRRVVETVAYRLDGKRAYQIKGPSLLEAAVQIREATLADRQHRAAEVWTFTSATRFTIRQSRAWRVQQASLAASLGRYGKLEDDLGDGTFIVDFAAEADCELVAPNSYRILKIRPGTFAD